MRSLRCVLIVGSESDPNSWWMRHKALGLNMICWQTPWINFIIPLAKQHSHRETKAESKSFPELHERLLKTTLPKEFSALNKRASNLRNNPNTYIYENSNLTRHFEVWHPILGHVLPVISLCCMTSTQVNLRSIERWCPTLILNYTNFQ